MTRGIGPWGARETVRPASPTWTAGGQRHAIHAVLLASRDVSPSRASLLNAGIPSAHGGMTDPFGQSPVREMRVDATIEYLAGLTGYTDCWRALDTLRPSGNGIWRHGPAQKVFRIESPFHRRRTLYGAPMMQGEKVGRTALSDRCHHDNALRFLRAGLATGQRFTSVSLHRPAQPVGCRSEPTRPSLHDNIQTAPSNRCRENPGTPGR
jgi:hypothetical protein